jgi:3-oxoacyl-(acyl-carrier-protein) synthase
VPADRDACATSTHAIGEAYRAIAGGYADAIIAGGSEATIIPLAVAGVYQLSGAEPVAGSSGGLAAL